jgi:predicted nucleic acid-binding protein
LDRRPDQELPFVPDQAEGGTELLLDTCVYVDVMQGRAPQRVMKLIEVRLCNHSSVVLAELTHLSVRLDPADARTKTVLTQIYAAIADIPHHRLTAPSTPVLAEAGILAGLTVRLGSVGFGRHQALLNDATLYLQAVDQGQTMLTRNVREFDWFDQLLPSGRVLFYRQA